MTGRVSVARSTAAAVINRETASSWAARLAAANSHAELAGAAERLLQGWTGSAGDPLATAAAVLT